MEQFTKAYGRTIYIMEEANCITLAVISRRVNSLMIWLKALVFTDMLMVANMLGIGTKINNMVLVKKNGMMEVSIKVFTKMLQKKVKVNIAGLMEIDILENGGIIC